MKRLSLLLCYLSVSCSFYSQQLMINEVSQGSGSSEYVEFVVIGSPICEGDPIPCIDLRKVIFDDNNGYFAPGSGTGIAPGALRFSNDIFWSCIPQGTYIVVYNEAQRNSSLPQQDDVSLTDGNCTLIIPGNSNLLESTGLAPNSNDPLYPPDGDWVVSQGWSGISMNNNNDSFQIPDLGVNGTPLHSVSWGNNTNGTIISFAGSVSNKVISFKNLVSNDFNDQANWEMDDIALAETPGAPNSVANDLWIGTMNPTCRVDPVLSFTTTPATCGVADGSATVDLSAVSPGSTVVWSTGADTPTATGLAAGTYVVAVTDAISGCTFLDSTVITNTGAATASVAATNETCVGACNGTAVITANGGTGNLTYTWDAAAGNQTTPSISALCSGSYTCVVTDENDCQTAVLVFIQAADPVSLSSSSINSTCSTADGSATVTATGNNGPYTITWGANTGGQVGNTASNLAAGVYVASIEDANNCIVTDTVFVNDQGAPTLSVTATSITCANPCAGTATVSVTGGTGTPSFQWDAAANNQSVATASDLCVGSYICTVTDQNNCVASIVANIETPQTLGLTVSFTNESCTSLCDGTIQFQVTNATGDLKVNLTKDQDAPQLIAATTITGLCPGSYVLDVEDANGCKAQETIVIGTTTVLINDISNDTTICAGQGLELLVTGTNLTNIVWSTTETTPNIQLTPTESGVYTVSFTQLACDITRAVQVNVLPCLKPINEQIEMPNVFTPNDDGINDYVVPVYMTNGVQVVLFTVLNRWGNVMYESDVIKWDGKANNGKVAHDGTYFYILSYNLAGQDLVTLHGFVQLVNK